MVRCTRAVPTQTSEDHPVAVGAVCGMGGGATVGITALSCTAHRWSITTRSSTGLKSTDQAGEDFGVSHRVIRQPSCRITSWMYHAGGGSPQARYWGGTMT